MSIEEEITNLNIEIDKLEKIFNTWNLKYYLNRLKSNHDILIDNKDTEIYVLKNRILELESFGIMKIEKTNIVLTYDKTSNRIIAYSNSSKINPIFDESCRKWFIPALNDNSYIKIKFIGKKFRQ
jgi:Flp pilus assembly CpaF family ATPase